METNILDNLPSPAPTASVIDRIKFLIKFSRRTQAKFAELIGVDPSNISKILSGKSPVSEAFINRLVVNLGVSKRWLLHGDDVPFAKNKPARETSSTQRSDRHDNIGAPVYDIDVTAGSVGLSRMFTDERIIGRLNIPGVSPKLPIVRVSGESMSPRIRNGAYLSIRDVGRDATILWGQIYVVVLEDYRMVKYLRRHDDPAKVVLHSENPNYDDIVINRSDIENLFLVESIINYEIVR